MKEQEVEFPGGVVNGKVGFQDGKLQFFAYMASTSEQDFGGLVALGLEDESVQVLEVSNQELGEASGKYSYSNLQNLFLMDILTDKESDRVYFVFENRIYKTQITGKNHYDGALEEGAYVGAKSSGGFSGVYMAPMMMPMGTMGGGMVMSGGMMMVGGSGLFIDQDELVVVATDQKLEKQWVGIVPKRHSSKQSSRHFGFKSFVHDGKLNFLFNDDARNDEREKKNKKLKKLGDWDLPLELMHVSFTAEGTYKPRTAIKAYGDYAYIDMSKSQVPGQDWENNLLFYETKSKTYPCQLILKQD